MKVVPFFGNDVRVYAQAYERVNGQRGPLVTSKRVTGDGVVGFVLPLDQTYGVRAYADVDQDGKQGPTDPATSVENLRPVADVNMQTGARDPDTPRHRRRAGLAAQEECAWQHGNFGRCPAATGTGESARSRATTSRAATATYAASCAAATALA